MPNVSQTDTPLVFEDALIGASFGASVSIFLSNLFVYSNSLIHWICVAIIILGLMGFPVLIFYWYMKHSQDVYIAVRIVGSIYFLVLAITFLQFLNLGSTQLACVAMSYLLVGLSSGFLLLYSSGLRERIGGVGDFYA